MPRGTGWGSPLTERPEFRAPGSFRVARGVRRIVTAVRPAAEPKVSSGPVSSGSVISTPVVGLAYMDLLQSGLFH